MKAPDARVTRSAAISRGVTAAVASLLAPTAARADITCCNLIGLDYKTHGGKNPGATGCALPKTSAKKVSNIRLVGKDCGESPPTLDGYTLKYVIPDSGIMGADEEKVQHGSATGVGGYKNMKQNVFVYVKV